MDQVIQATEKGPVKWLVLFLRSISAFTLFALMLITCVDVVGRYVFNSPFTGSTELTEMAVGIIIFSILPIISWRNEHVVVDLLDPLVSPLVHMFRCMILNTLIAIALAFVGYRITILGARSLSYEEVTEYLEIPTGWMMNFIGVACWVTAIMVITIGIYRSYHEYRQTIITTATNDQPS